MRYVFGVPGVFALGLMLSVGCSEDGAPGFPCTEEGIRDAIAEGGGPHTFDCDGAQTVVTEFEIVIDNDVLLDGEGNLTVDGNERHRVFWIRKGVVAELRGFLVTGGTPGFQHDAGGINNNGTLTLINSTVSGNSAAEGGSIRNLRGTVTLTNMLVEDDCQVSEGSSIVSLGYNIESPGNTCGFDQATDQVDITAAELNLGSLQDNGGPTETHALGAGSLAIDVIPEAECVDADGAPLTTDQRGEPRDSMCDVGAFEVKRRASLAEALQP